jgi:hypothetical protein
MLPEAPMAPDVRFAAQRHGNKIFNYFETKSAFPSATMSA